MPPAWGGDDGIFICGSLIIGCSLAQEPEKANSQLLSGVNAANQAICNICGIFFRLVAPGGESATEGTGQTEGRREKNHELDVLQALLGKAGSRGWLRKRVANPLSILGASHLVRLHATYAASAAG